MNWEKETHIITIIGDLKVSTIYRRWVTHEGESWGWETVAFKCGQLGESLTGANTFEDACKQHKILCEQYDT